MGQKLSNLLCIKEGGISQVSLMDLIFLLIEEKGSCLRNWKNESETKLGREYLEGRHIRFEFRLVGLG